MRKQSFSEGPTSGSGRAADRDALANLDEIAMFEGLTEPQLAAVRPVLRTRTLRVRDVLIEAELPGEAAFIIRSGYLRIQTTRADGEEIILAILGPGDIVGEMSLVDRLGRSATVIAHEPSSVLALNRAVFTALIERIPAIGLNLARVLTRRLRLANAQIMALGTMDVDNRIARQLLTYATEYGERTEGTAVRLPFHLTQSDIACLVGASRVRVNQVLGDYRRRGLIAVDERLRITITDPVAWAREEAW
jgi:CRP/FNR family cyclic AMP-dependent transcriptional regulator